MIRDNIRNELLRIAKREKCICCICHSEDITMARFDAEEKHWLYRCYCSACAEKMRDYELELMSQAEIERHRGAALLSSEGSA